jgi:hypothetical protein
MRRASGDYVASKGSDDEGEDESVILNKSGKGAIPYRKKHKELRVGNDLIFE